MASTMHGQWSSRWAFVLAATGSAVGLGNIWRFPYLTGENGGGAFVLIYLACVLAIGIPIMMAEVMLGRRGRMSPINALREISAAEGKTGLWVAIGWMGTLSGFLILSFYAVVAGWTLAYAVRASAGVFQGISLEAANAMFGALVGDPERLLAWHTIFMALTVFIVARGVEAGLERAVRWMMPALFILLVLLVGYAANTGDFSAAVDYLFSPDWSKVSARSVLDAMGQAFFSLSLGMGAMLMYGSYLDRDASIPRMSLIIAAADTVVAVLAGLAIFPLVFGFGLASTQGPGLIFKVLPVAFGQMPGGSVFAVGFFALLVFAALTSAISLLEPVSAWMVEKFDLTRVQATSIAGLISWTIGVAALLSLNLWEKHTLFGKGIFDLLDYVTANILLPLGGVLIAVFSSWVLSPRVSQQEFDQAGHEISYRMWMILARYVAPFAVLLVFLHAIGLI